MEKIATIGLDIGKRVLQVHAADSTGRAVLQRKLRREEVKPAPLLTTGRARSRRLVMMPG